jgi:opacity protein-like surface antigen
MLSGLAASAAAILSGDLPADRRFLDPYVAGRIAIEISDANQFEYDPGVAGILAAGVGVGRKWRLEYAVARRSTNITGIPPLPATGAHSTWSHLLIAYYHPFGTDAKISPFIGVGGGFDIAKLRARVTDPDPRFAGLGFPAQRHVSKALQGAVGVAVKATKRIDLDASFVYFSSDDRDFVSTFANNPTVEAAYRTYGLQFGARYSF